MVTSEYHRRIYWIDGGKNVALVQRYCSCEFKSKIIVLVNILRLFCKFEAAINTGSSSYCEVYFLNQRE